MDKLKKEAADLDDISLKLLKEVLAVLNDPELPSEAKNAISRIRLL